MPGIKRPDLFKVNRNSKLPKGDVDYIEEAKIQYCQSCLQAGIRSPLRKRIYKVQTDKEGKRNLVPATVPDADRFRQCLRCGDIVPIYNIKYESKIEDFVEPIDNPFDMNPGNMDAFAPGRDRLKLNKGKSIYKRKRQQIEALKDEDIKQELKHGATLTAYFET